MKAIESNSRKRPLPDGYLCFALDGTSHAHRSSYSNERREQVHEVRKVGACLRCQLLKKSCSKGEPCTTCLRAAAKSSASRSLAWMDCIRPSLMNVTIYGSSAKFDPDLKLGGIPVLQYLAHGDVDLKFDIPFQWNIDELSAFVAGWLVNDHDAPRASMVGIMSSASLLSVISDLVGPELAQVFKALIYTSSLIFNSSNGRIIYSENSNDIRILRHCGHRLLLHLESHIKPTTLARLKKHELYALFLMLLGCIISSKYVAESLGDLSRLSSHYTSSATHQQVQPATMMHSDLERGSELIRLLAHQMVYVGHSTGLLREGMDKNLIEDLTSTRWRKKAIFTWEQVEIDAGPLNGVSSEYSDMTTCSASLAKYESQMEESDFQQIDLSTRLPTFRSPSSADDPNTRNLPPKRPKRRRDSHSVSDHHVNQLRQGSSCAMCRIRTPQEWRTKVGQTGKQMNICKSCLGSSTWNCDLALYTGGRDDLVKTHVPFSGDNKAAAKIEQTISDAGSNALSRPYAPGGNNAGVTKSMCKRAPYSRSSDDFISSHVKFGAYPSPWPLDTRIPASAITTTNFSRTNGAYQTLNHNSEQPSPFDFNVAAFDPTLPTNDIDLFSLLHPDTTELWPCLNRVPTPPPEPDPELEEQMKEFELRYADWLSGESSDFQTFTTSNTGASAGRCSNERALITPELDSPFLATQKRLLL